MNKKLLGFTLAFIFIAMLATPLVGAVMAGKGQTKQYYEFYLEGGYVPGPDTKMWTTNGGITQIRDLVFIATYIEVTVGGDIYYPDPLGYVGTMDATLNTDGKLNIRVHESFVVDGLGTITQRTAETVTGFGTPDAAGGGNFVGLGSDGLEGVKIQGTSSLVEGSPTRVGTVMGWP